MICGPLSGHIETKNDVQCAYSIERTKKPRCHLTVTALELTKVIGPNYMASNWLSIENKTHHVVLCEKT